MRVRELYARKWNKLVPVFQQLAHEAVPGAELYVVSIARRPGSSLSYLQRLLDNSPVAWSSDLQESDVLSLTLSIEKTSLLSSRSSSSAAARQCKNLREFINITRVALCVRVGGCPVQDADEQCAYLAPHEDSQAPCWQLLHKHVLNK